MDTPETKYARSGDLSIAYQVVGDGPIDLVHIPGIVSHVDLAWENPGYRRFMDRLSSFARVIVYDKRGTGLSDPVTEPPSVEERIDDTRAVMDALDVERAAIFGCSEGALLAAFFAATYPQRVTHAILYGSFARMQPDPPDYPWGFEDEIVEELREGALEAWGEGFMLTLLAPSMLGDDRARTWWGRFERASTSPRTTLIMAAANFELDLRGVLPSVQAPTLVLHRSSDVLPIEGARYVADHIPRARFTELHGDDHWPWINDPDEVCDHVEEFLTGTRREPDPDRVLATVLFTDIVGSTERAAELGDSRWRGLLDAHESIVRAQLDWHKGREVKMTGDGFLATFDGPARAIRCARDAVNGLRDVGIEIRTGVHTGECELRNGDIGGIAVHIGARVMGSAGPGEVLVSSTVKDLTVGSDINFEDRGNHPLKGVPGKWHLYAVAPS
ncbi:MAG: adenylate/guanylate cyclase domain-containing protein [Thermoleophilaceae bacterium]|nr:adenylate/guanylate cyclase domain-containing protein [Thermoleophilaceae bacterium]